MLNTSTQIREKLKCLLEESCIDISYRVVNPSQWLEAYNFLSKQSVQVSSAAIDYEIAYEQVNNRTFEDLSAILLVNGQAVALWPLALCFTASSCELTSFGGFLTSPSFLQQVPPTLQSKISKNCYKV